MTPEYQRQLDYIFNRPTDEPDWYWRDSLEEEAVFDETPLSAFTFLETLCLNPEKDLEAYSDAQIGLGFCFVFNNSCSNLTHDDCLVMYAGMNVFATNNEAKYEHYKSILKHYTF